MGSLVFNAFTLARRVGIAAILVLLYGYSNYQIVLMMAQSTISLSYLATYQPLEERSSLKLEVFNECCTLLATYHLFSYTDAYGVPAIKLVAGRSMIAVVLFMLLVNAIIMLVQSFCEIGRKIKSLFMRCNRQKIYTNERYGCPGGTLEDEQDLPSKLVSTSKFKSISEIKFSETQDKQNFSKMMSQIISEQQTRAVDIHFVPHIQHRDILQGRQNPTASICDQIMTQ